MPRPLHALLSLALPAALIALIGWQLGRPQPWEPVKSVIEQQEKLAQARPDIVVVGNSKAISDIDAKTLSRALGGRVAQIKEDGSSAGMWYALLKYRVFGEGHRPRVVIALGMLDSMLQARLLPPKGPMVLGWHTADPDAVLLEKGLGVGGNAALARVKQHRGAWRAGLLDGIKYRATGMIGADEAATDAALSEVFGEDAIEQGHGPARVLPVMEADAAATPEVEGVDATFLPDLARLCEEHGAKLVMVRGPLPAGSTEDRYRPDQIRPVLELLNRLGVGWLDYRSALPDALFKDVRHLGTDGRVQFTERLVEDLSALGLTGVGGDLTLRAARLPLVPDRVERTGEPPALPPLKVEAGGAGCEQKALLPGLAHLSEEAAAAAGIGSVSPLEVWAGSERLRLRAKATDLKECAGAFVHRNRLLLLSHPPDADPAAPPAYRLGWREEIPQTSENFPPVWWVLPGTALTLSFPDPPDTPGPLPIRLDAAGFSPAGAAPAAPALTAAGQVTALRQGEGGWWLEATLPPQQGRWEIRVASPADGPALAIRSLQIGDQRVIGAEPPLQVRLTDQPPSWPAPPPPLSATFSPAPADSGGCLDLPDLLHLSNSRLNRSNLPGCSPVQVLEDGQPLAPSREQLAAFRALSGVYSHADTCMRLQPSAGSISDHRYDLRLDPARDCGKFYWLYPGDTVRLTAKGVVLGKLRGPMGRLLLAGSVRVPEGAAISGDLAIRVVSQEKDGTGRVWYVGSVPLASIEGEGTSLSLPEPLPRTLRDFYVELQSSPGAPFTVLKNVALEELPVVTIHE